jgi:hypothetical protein
MSKLDKAWDSAFAQDADVSTSQLKATGATLVQYLKTSKEVRDWAKSERYNRAQEAFIVDGFRAQRQRDGLSENV